MKTVTLTAHFDVEHIQLGEPFPLPSEARLLVTILPEASADTERPDHDKLVSRSELLTIPWRRERP